MMREIRLCRHPALTLLLAGCLFCLGAQAQEKKYSQELARTAIRLWPDSFQLESPDKPVKWSYDLGVILEGIEGVWKATGNADWFQYIQQQMDVYVQEDGTIRGYKSSEYNMDHLNNGKALLLLYQVTGKEKYRKAVTILRNQLKTHPRTPEGGFWHKQIYPQQMWLDGLYMGQPFYAGYAAVFKEDSIFNDVVRQFVLMETHARDVKTGLLYHGWDASHQQAWANKVTGTSPHFWGRALGWYGMALVDALPFFPEQQAGRDTLIAILNRLAEAVVRYQDKGTGLWYDIVDFAGRKGNYPEASASAMLTYTLAKGVRLGYLPVRYLTSAQKGYKGILNRFISKDAAGHFNLEGTVKVSGLGGKPYRDGSFDYYVGEPVIRNDPKGLGAFINCAVEMEMLPMQSVGKGKTVLLDYYYNHEYQKDKNGRVSRFHYTWEEQDNGGYSLLGHIFRNYGARTDSLGEKPTAQNLKNAAVYIIVDPDTEAESPSPYYIAPGEVAALSNWVKQGGVLVLLGNDAGNAEFKHFNQLAERFGIHFNEDNALMVKNNQFEQGAVYTQADNPVFRQAFKIYLKEMSTLRISSPAKVLLTQQNMNLMATARYGKGAVFALGDPWIYNEYLDGRKLPKDFENYPAAEAWVKWLLTNATINEGILKR